MAISKWILSLGAVLTLASTGLVSQSAYAINGLAYVAKFVCGTKSSSPGTSATPGHYATSIIVTNPNPAVAVCGNKYFVIANAQSKTRGPASASVLEVLGPSEAVRVNCTDVRDAFSPAQSGFIEGSMVLEIIPDPNEAEPPTLSVTSVYTAKKRTPAGVTGQATKEWDVETMSAVPTAPSEIDFPSDATPTFPCP